MDIILKPREHLKLINFIIEGFRKFHQIDLNFKGANYYISIPSLADGKEMYIKHMRFIGKMENLSKKFHVIKRKLQRSSNKEVIAEKNKILEKIDLCEKCRPIVKRNCFKCLGSVKKREKGVDVNLAIDMVKGAFNDEFDYCVLISGDADFIPALELIGKLHKTPLSSFILCKSYATNLKSKFKHYFIRRENIEFLIK